MTHSLFAMELCLRLDAACHVQQHLCASLPVQNNWLGVGGKWQYYRHIAQVLLANLHLAESGCWDYFDDPERARSDFEMWKNGMLTAEGARHEQRVLSLSEPRYITFTMAFLLVKDSPSDLMMCKSCDVPEASLWNRAVFARLLNDFGHVSFASVFADVSYLIPRDPPWALTAEDMAHPKFHYLRRLV
jgi:hypothetical protein